MDTTVIAVAGKGGVGKTSISAAIVRQLVRDYPDKRILAIDADPAVGLETSLGVRAGYTVDDIRREIAEAGRGDAEKKKAIELLGESRFRLLDAITEAEGFSFLAVGRPEAAGCYCGVNGYLRTAISRLAENFDYVVIDGEAGVEQINRRVMERVDVLLLVSDASRKGTNVISTIRRVAGGLGMCQKSGAILNRLAGPEALEYLDTGDIPVLAAIGEDPLLAMADVRGESIFTLPEDSALLSGVRKALEAIGVGAVS